MKKSKWEIAYIVFCIVILLLFTYAMLDFFVIPSSYEGDTPKQLSIVTPMESTPSAPMESTPSAPTESTPSAAIEITPSAPIETANATASVTISQTQTQTQTQTQAQTPKGTPVATLAPTAKPTATITPMPTGYLSDNTYHDNNIDIVVTKYRMYDTDVYVADVKLSSVFYLKTAFAKDTFGKNIIETTSTQAKRNNAIIAINGDFYGKRENGYVIRNAKLYRSSVSKTNERNTDIDLAILQNGAFKAFSEKSTDIDTVVSWNPWHVLCFGPAILNNGEIAIDKNYDVLQHMDSNPRTAIGMVEPLHYLLVVSDGRTSSNAGLSLIELATVFKNLGATVAYNLDGGGSTTMYFNGKVINKPYNSGKITERYVSDIVYVSP